MVVSAVAPVITALRRGKSPWRDKPAFHVCPQSHVTDFMNRFTRSWRDGVAAYKEGVPPDPQTPARSLSPADQKFWGIVTPIACLLAVVGSYYAVRFGWWPLVCPGIMLPPVALAIRRRYFSR